MCFMMFFEGREGLICNDLRGANQAQINANHGSENRPKQRVANYVICYDLQLICGLQIAANQGPSAASSSKEQPETSQGAAREQPRADRNSQGATKSSQGAARWQPGGLIYDQIRPDTAKYRQIQLDIARYCQRHRLKTRVGRACHANARRYME